MTVRKRLIAGNWKMYKTRGEALSFVTELKDELTAVEVVISAGAQDAAPEAVVCAPFTALGGLAEALSSLRVGLGAQNMHQVAEGAYTGEVSARMLQDVGCSHVILGHSERRAYFAETDETVAGKTVVALQAGLRPIVCVGESLQEREAGQTEQVIRTQMGAVLAALKEGLQPGALDVRELVIAYEPIWAIGTGKSSSAADAQQVIGLIRELVIAALGADVGQAVRILYGGSVKPENIATYVGEPDIDGALVGGASLQAASYAALLKHSATGK